MGNEVSTVGGAIATAATSVAAGVTFGQVDALNNAAVECAKFTGNAASKTVVRHVGETVGSAVATGAMAAASGATFGRVDTLNKTVVKLAKHTAEAAVESGKVVIHTTNEVANGMPVIGHIKGGIHYAIGDRKSGNEAMKKASRSTGVVVGGVLGVSGGPVGMVAGGIAGGAVMDGITTGVESAIEGKYTPAGQIKAWTNVATGKDPQTIIGGVVGGVMSPIMDGVGGYDVGTLFKGGRVTHPHDHHDLAEFDHVEVPIESDSEKSKPVSNHSKAERENSEDSGASSAVTRADRGEDQPHTNGREAEDRSSEDAEGVGRLVGEGRKAEGLGSDEKGGVHRRMEHSAGEARETEFEESQREVEESKTDSGESEADGEFGEWVYVSATEISEGEDERREGVSDEGESSGGTGVTGRPLGCSGSSIIHAWKTVLSEEEGEIIHLSKLEDGTLYRGVNKGENPYSADGHEARLGEGVHFTDDLDEAIDFATLRQAAESSYRVNGEVYHFAFKAAEWRDYMKNWTLEQEGMVRTLHSIDEFQVIKTTCGSANHYRFSPHIAEVMEQRDTLVKIRDVSTSSKCSLT